MRRGEQRRQARRLGKGEAIDNATQEYRDEAALAHVFVVEDDRDLRELLIELLEDHGYRASGAADGLQALEYLSSADDLPSLILMDLVMPRMDGFHLRAELLGRPRLAGIPVVVISACHRYADRFHGMQVAGCLEKPVVVDTLLDLTRAILRGDEWFGR